MIKKNIEDFLLLVSDDPRDLFWYFNTSELHGLDFDSCCQRLKEGGSYIDGLCNISPIHDGKPFIFLNSKTMSELTIWESALLVMHETTHLMFHFREMQLIKNPTLIQDPEFEERLIEDAELYAKKIMHELKFPSLHLVIEEPVSQICKICQN
jgi:hypothetical protein